MQLHQNVSQTKESSTEQPLNQRSRLAVTWRPTQCLIPLSGNSKRPLNVGGPTSLTLLEVPRLWMTSRIWLICLQISTLWNMITGTYLSNKQCPQIMVIKFYLIFLSLLRYRTMTEADYGYLYCWAENIAGSQREPCRYEIVRESAPDPPKYCQPLNVTWERIEAACQSGFDGGHLPTFHCEVYKSEGHLRLVYNLSNSEAPQFMLDSLEAGAEYHIVVYASNILGEKVIPLSS